MSTPDLYERLAAPFPPDRISWRVGASNKKSRQKEHGQNAKATKGQALAYIDARDVMERLDEVVGPGAWQNRYPHANGKTVCEIGILVPRLRRIPGAGPGGCTLVEDDGSDWVWKSDGAGDTDHEAEKGAMSDAFKRAAVRWGIGRYLYNIPSVWVELDEREQIAKHEYPRLQRLLPGSVVAHDVRPDEHSEPKAESGPLIMARGLLQSAQSKDQFTEIWTANKAGWKGVMSDADYRAIVKTMHDEAQRWAAKVGEPKGFGDVSDAASHINGKAA